MNWRKAVIPLFDQYIKKSPVQEYVTTLRAFYALPLAQQQQIQSERLTALLQHAANNVPYYRSMLADAGVYVEGVIHLERFAHIPFLTKDILRSQFDQLQSADLADRTWYRNTSGGSTGEPVVFLQDNDYHELGMATKTIQYELSGKYEGEPHVKLWGSDRDILEGSIGTRAKLSNFLRNQMLLNSYLMNDTRMDEFVTFIKHKKPKVVEAYVQSAYELARYMRSRGETVTDVGFVLTSAGTLFPSMREEIEAAFRCNVINRYGSREVGDMACEREGHQGLHVSLYTHLIEIVDAEGLPVQPGEVGEIVVTSLSNFAMPLLRYRIGDRGIPSQTGNDGGIGIARIDSITGRTRDVFITSSGTIVDGAYFTHLAFFRKWIKQFQFVQESVDLIVLRVVKHENASPPREELSDIAAKIKHVMGHECRVQFEYVAEIAPNSSGKYRYTISKVQQDQPAEPISA